MLANITDWPLWFSLVSELDLRAPRIQDAWGHEMEVHRPRKSIRPPWRALRTARDAWNIGDGRLGIAVRHVENSCPHQCVIWARREFFFVESIEIKGVFIYNAMQMIWLAVINVMIFNGIFCNNIRKLSPTSRSTKLNQILARHNLESRFGVHGGLKHSYHKPRGILVYF